MPSKYKGNLSHRYIGSYFHEITQVILSLSPLFIMVLGWHGSILSKSLKCDTFKKCMVLLVKFNIETICLKTNIQVMVSKG